MGNPSSPRRAELSLRRIPFFGGFHMKCKSGSLAERARLRGNVPRAGACREYSTNVWIVVRTINQQYPYCSTTRSTSSGSTVLLLGARRHAPYPGTFGALIGSGTCPGTGQRERAQFRGNVPRVRGTSMVVRAMTCPETMQSECSAQAPE